MQRAQLQQALPLQVLPSGRALGAEVRGLDLARPLAPEAVAAVHRAWSEHQVLLFRGQRLSEDQHLAFSRQLGPIEPPHSTSQAHFSGRYPEILVVSNIGEDGQPKDYDLGNAEAMWHTDMSYRATPPSGSALYAREIPPVGGNTCFLNMYRAYETLPAELLRAIEGRTCVHDESRNSAGRLRAGYSHEPDPRKTPGPQHPLVRTHPVTGRKALFLGRRPYAYIPGLELEESEALLDRLWAHATQDAFVWSHVWQVGDLVLWDNRCTMHRRDPFDMSHRRIMHRTQICGDRPY
jgi:alpha-ketoglutarate-dependent taurine dioxygenase